MQIDGGYQFPFLLFAGGDQCRGISIYSWEEPAFHPGPRRWLLPSSPDFRGSRAPGDWTEESDFSGGPLLQDIPDLRSTISMPSEIDVGGLGHNSIWCQGRGTRIKCSESLQGLLPFQTELRKKLPGLEAVLTADHELLKWSNLFL